MISLGVYPTSTLADVRSRRDDARKLVVEGKNPSEIRKEQKVALQTETERALEKMCKVRLRCSEIFRYAIAIGRAEFNPAADLSSALEVHQSNHFLFLKADDIPDFLRVLDRYTGSRLVQMATKLLKITGVRTIELRAAPWSEFDLDNAIWEIPAERMKMHRPYLVPLSVQALDLLNELKIMTGNYRYVFPGRNDPNKFMSEASVNQVINRIGYKGKVTGHCFRHMM